MVQLTLTNEQGVSLCRLQLAPSATVQQLLTQLFLVKPDLRRGATVLRNDVRHTSHDIQLPTSNLKTLVQAGLTTEEAAAETLILSGTSAPATSTTADAATARILELFGNSAARPAAAPASSSAISHRAVPPASQRPQQHAAAAAPASFAPDAFEGEGLDPAEVARQRQIYEYIQQQQINENLANALEYTPEAFARVVMLYVPCTINQVPVKAFVDSGAQMSIMNRTTAERCGLMRLVDTRMRGVAVGVGRQEILGRIHMAPVNLSGLHIPFSFSVIAEQDIDLIIGLDQLKRHQMLIDLRQNCLTIDTVSVPFLPEVEIPKRPGIDDTGDEEGGEVSATTTTAGGAGAGAGVGGGDGGGAAPAPPLQNAEGSLVPSLRPATTTTTTTVAPSPTPGSPVNVPPPTLMSDSLSTSTAASPPPLSSTSQPAAAATHAAAAPENRATQVHSFMAFTGITDPVQAAELLEAADWDPDAAASLYFEE